MTRRKRVELYRWLLTADPPVCKVGNPVTILNTCERRRRGEECWCRFDVVAVADDLEAVGADELVELLNDDLEPEDVELLAGRLAAAMGSQLDDADAEERGTALVRRLSRVAKAGSGLSDAYAEEIDD